MSDAAARFAAKYGETLSKSTRPAPTEPQSRHSGVTRAAEQNRMPLPSPPVSKKTRSAGPDVQATMVDWLRLSANHVPPSWADPVALPPHGSHCSCCRGQRWWCEREAPKGWRCATCHPPDHLMAERLQVLPSATAVTWPSSSRGSRQGNLVATSERSSNGDVVNGVTYILSTSRIELLCRRSRRRAARTTISAAATTTARWTASIVRSVKCGGLAELACREASATVNQTLNDPSSRLWAELAAQATIGSAVEPMDRHLALS